jgi:hypothetical protein
MPPRLTREEVIALFDKLNNQGRWGKDDERGALNFITDKKRAAAARLVQTGEVVSLALPLATAPAPDNPTPVTHLMHQTGYDAHEQGLMPFTADYFAISPHGHAVTLSTRCATCSGAARCTTALTRARSDRMARANARSTSRPTA